MMNVSGAIAANGEYQTLAALYDKSNKLLIPISATGNGTGVFTLNLYTTVTSSVAISGIGRFYTNSTGTLGESTTSILTANTLNTLYVRLSRGSSYIIVDNVNAIPCFGSNTHGGAHYAFVEATNGPKINGLNISYLRFCTKIRINSDLNLSVIGGSVAGLTLLTYLFLSGSLLTCSGSVAGLTLLKYLFLSGSLLTCSGSVAGLTLLTNLTLSGSLLTCSGSVKELLKKLTNWYIEGVGLSIYYETPDSFPASIDRYYLASAVITPAMSDQIFIDLANSNVIASGIYRRLSIPVPSGAISSASLAARTTLATPERGPFTITVHS